MSKFQICDTAHYCFCGKNWGVGFGFLYGQIILCLVENEKMRICSHKFNIMMINQEATYEKTNILVLSSITSHWHDANDYNG